MHAPADMLQFMIRGRRCAMYVQSVKEVVPMPAITPVPLAAAPIRGVMPLRGHPVAVLDLGPELAPTREDGHVTGFDMQRKSQDEFVLMVEAPGLGEGHVVRAALCVEKVLSVRSISPEQIRTTPAGPAFISGALVDADGPALVIDAARMMEHVQNAVSQAKVAP